MHPAVSVPIPEIAAILTSCVLTRPPSSATIRFKGWVHGWVRTMARAIGKLTSLAVDRAKRRGYYGDGGGLFLQVSASGSKSWVFRFKEAGKLREMGLGATHTIALEEGTAED